MLDKQHILIIVSSNSPMGGLHLNIIDSITFLLRSNINVTVISQDGPFSKEVRQLGADYISINFNDTKEYNVRYIKSKINKPTLIHTHPFQAKDMALALVDEYKIPLIMTHHSINDNNVKSYEKYIDIFIVVSGLVKDFLIKQDINPNKIFIVPNGLDIEFFNKVVGKSFFNFDKRYKTILTVSRFSKDKKFITDSIYQALKYFLYDKKFDFNWIFVGDGEELNTIKEIAKEFNLQTNREMIIFLGWQDRKDIVTLYKECDIFIGPGRSVIEAMNFENLIIALGSKGYVGILDETNYLNAIYTNFGGDGNLDNINQLYYDLQKLLKMNQDNISSLNKLNNIILRNFFDLNQINPKLLNLYQMLNLITPISIRKYEEEQRIKKLFEINDKNYKFRDSGIFEVKDKSLIIKQDNSEVIYLISGGHSLNSIPKEDYRVELINKFTIELDIRLINSEVRLFILEFNRNEKIASKSYILKDGFNLLKHRLNTKTTLIKIAFRISTKEFHHSYLQINKILFVNNFVENYISQIKHRSLTSKNIVLDGEYTYSFITAENKYIYYLNKKKSKKLLISFNGAINRDKRTYEFQRFSWSNEIDSSLMVFLDPSINAENNLSIGWYQGSEKEFAINVIADYIKSFLIQYDIKEENVCFLGSSAGGFAILKLANLFLKSQFVAINPQLYLFNYYQNIFRNSIKNIFGSQDIDFIIKKYKERFEINLNLQNREESIYIFQNICDKHHYIKHLEKFLKLQDQQYITTFKEYNLEKFVVKNDKLNIILYKDEITGHIPPSKEITLNIINKLMNKGL